MDKLETLCIKKKKDSSSAYMYVYTCVTVSSVHPLIYAFGLKSAVCCSRTSLLCCYRWKQ